MTINNFDENIFFSDIEFNYDENKSLFLGFCTAPAGPPAQNAHRSSACLKKVSKNAHRPSTCLRKGSQDHVPEGEAKKYFHKKGTTAYGTTAAPITFSAPNKINAPPINLRPPK